MKRKDIPKATPRAFHPGGMVPPSYGPRPIRGVGTAMPGTPRPSSYTPVQADPSLIPKPLVMDGDMPRPIPKPPVMDGDMPRPKPRMPRTTPTPRRPRRTPRLGGMPRVPRRGGRGAMDRLASMYNRRR